MSKTTSQSDRALLGATKLFSIAIIIFLIAMVVSLVVDSWPTIAKFNWHFVTSENWDPASNHFGALTAIIGTLVTSLIAIIIAIPLSLGIAVAIVSILPKTLAQIVARLIELMAGIPSIIYGMWGLFVFAPFMSQHVQPWLIQTFANVWGLNFIFGGLPIGIGVFTAGIVLAIMILPLISSVMRDVLSEVPDLLFEASYGVGATRWEVMRHVIFPYVRSGFLGAAILGLGRALGETMAVTFVIGNSHQLLTGLFMPGTTISATIANEFTEAFGKLYPSALIELGLILFVITFIVLACARYLLNSMQPGAGE